MIWTVQMQNPGISHYIWSAKYRRRAGDREERTVAETWQRMAIAHAAPEPDDRRADRFLEIPEDFKVLPGGRIQAGVGTERNVSLFNCFVMGVTEDSIPGYFTATTTGFPKNFVTAIELPSGSPGHEGAPAPVR
jgi:ribonucleoside-diphosphate reductase alpha chain